MGDYRNGLCLSVCLSVRLSVLLSFRNTFLSLERFSLNFGHIFASVSQCAEPIINHANSRSRSQVKVMGLSLEFRVGSISPIPLEGNCLNFGCMFASVRLCAELITQLCRHKLKVTVQGLSLEFHVHSVSPIPVEGFSLNFGQMFTLVRRCAESISQPCLLKVKVTVHGHVFEPWISCPLCISFTPGRIFSKLWSNVPLSGTMCRTHNSALQT